MMAITNDAHAILMTSSFTGRLALRCSLRVVDEILRDLGGSDTVYTQRAQAQQRGEAARQLRISL